MTSFFDSEKTFHTRIQQIGHVCALCSLRACRDSVLPIFRNFDLLQQLIDCDGKEFASLGPSKAKIGENPDMALS